MPRFQARELAQWTGGRWEPAVPDFILNGVCSDTRTLKPGNIFVALRGANFDGHAFVNDALVRGAQAAIVGGANSFSLPAGKALLRVKEPLVALRDAAREYRQKVNPRIIGITGSVGKSTVKEMISAVIGAAGKSAATKGNWNNEIGLSQSLLAMEDDCRTGVFEVGTNHPGEIADLCGILAPDWGVVTNIGPVHIANFGTEKAIAEEKGMLMKALPAGGIAVLDCDSEFFALLRGMTRASVVTVGTGADADYTWKSTHSGELECCEKKSGERKTIQILQPGRHNLYNAALAVAIGRCAGISWDLISLALSKVSGLPMRWEERLLEGRLFINDAYNANPVSMRASLDTFAGKKVAGRKWVVLSGMLELGDREEPEHVALGAYAAKGAWAGLIVVGPLGRRISAGAAQAGFPRQAIHECADQHEAAALLESVTQEGDAILLKASRGMRLEDILTGLRRREAAIG